MRWDDPLPYCSGSSCSKGLSWCSDRWCYVDVNNCASHILAQKTSFWPSLDLYYSYQTCGAIDQWTGENVRESSAETTLTEFEVSIIVGEPGKWVADSMVTALYEALESEGFRVASIQRPPSITEEERNLRNLSIPLNNNLGCSAIVARPLTSSTCIGDESSCPCDDETLGQAYRPLLVQSVFHAFVGDLPNFAQEVLGVDPGDSI